MDITRLSASSIGESIRKGAFSAREVVQEYMGRITRFDAKIRAYITVFENDALDQADRIDKKIAAGKNAGLLAGIPIAIKDNVCIQGTRTTCASKMLEQYHAPYDAHIIERLKQEGAICIGKTNLDEFAMGSSTENSGFFTTCNPWDTAYIPGGSSGGSAASVAASLAPWAIGSDTGGSIRQPASYCGIVGMKPTYGRVSRYGLIAFGSSLDQIGSLTRSVRDTAMLLRVIAGYDRRDSTSLDEPVPDYLQTIDRGVKGMKIGLPKEYFTEGLDRDVDKAIQEAVRVFKDRGAQVVDISLPHTKYAVSAYYIIAPSEASANLARYDGVKYGHRSKKAADLYNQYKLSRGEGFGSEVKRRIMLGTYALSSGYYDAYYAKAQKVRSLIQKDFMDCFNTVDVILTPTAPTPAFRIGEKADDPLKMYLSDVFTISCNLAGIPGISIPCGFAGRHLPIGLQILGPLKGEEIVLQAAHAFQADTDFHLHVPGDL